MLKLVSDRQDLITCIPLAVMILFTTVRVLSLSGVTFYPTIYRTTSEYTFNTSLTNSFFLDGLIVLLAGLFVINATIANKFRFLSLAGSSVFVLTSIMLTLNLNELVLDVAGIALLPFIAVLGHFKCTSSNSTILRPINKVFLALALIASVLLLEVTSIIRWITYPAFPSTIFRDSTWSAAYLESSLFYIVGLLSPYVMLLLLFSFLLKGKLVHKFKYLLTRKTSWIKRFIVADSIEGQTKLLANSEVISNLIKRSDYRFWLAISLILSVVFAIYPYLPSINPDNFAVGYDLHYYIDWVKQLQHANAEDITQLVFTSFRDGDRPLTLLFIYAIYSITNLPVETVVQFFPLVLGPTLVLAVYYFVKFGTGNNKQLAGISALMTVVSYYFIVGMYAGFLANWLALVTAFLSLLILLRTFEKPSLAGYALLTLTTLTTLFIHAYTWSYFISSIILYLIISYAIYRKDRQKLRSIVFLAMIVSINIAVDVIRSQYTVSTGGIESSTMLASRGIALSNLFLLWQNLNWNFTYYVGGYFTNFVILALALFWTLSSKFSRNFDRMLLSTLYIGVIPVLFGDFNIQTRIFYNMPVHIPAAIVLYRLISNNASDNTNARFPLIFYKLTFYSIMLHLLNYGFRAVANYYMV